MVPSIDGQRPDPRESAPPSPRDRSIDVAKGLAIILIVVGHVWRGMAAAGLLTGHPELTEEVDTALYAVHLPVFALLAGLFVQRSVDRSGGTAYLRRRTLDFAWLFVVWTVLQSTVRVLAASRTNHPLAAGEFLRTFWVKDSQMWFLPFLLVATILAVALRPWRSRRIAVLSTALIALISMATWGRDLPWIGVAGLPLLPFFWTGCLLRADGLALRWRRQSWLIVAALGAGITTAALAWTDPATPTWSAGPPTATSVGVGVLASAAGTTALLALAHGLSRAQGMPWLAFLGRRSLEIFLGHIVAAAGCRILLIGAGITAWPVHLVLGSLAGVTFSLALWWIARRGPLRYLFAAPDVTTRGRARSAPS